MTPDAFGSYSQRDIDSIFVSQNILDDNKFKDIATNDGRKDTNNTNNKDAKKGKVSGPLASVNQVFFYSEGRRNSLYIVLLVSSSAMASGFLRIAKSLQGVSSSKPY